MSPRAASDAVEVAYEQLHSGSPSHKTINESAEFAEKYVTEDLHPAFATNGIRYQPDNDCFAAEIDGEYDDTVLIDSQKAFTKALEQFQQGMKYKSKVNLRAMHTWEEVIEYANEARDKYTGVSEEEGIVKKIDQRLKTFQTAAPAIQAWLKLLPSTTWFGSIICGGLTILLEAAVYLRKLRKETLSVLAQMPLCIEKAHFFMRTYGYPKIDRQVGDLYLAIIEALQDILEWYKYNAGMKYIAAFVKGPAYAERLKSKMKKIQAASEAMQEKASEKEQLRLGEIRSVAVETNDQIGELKILALEARNHLYNVFKDTEVWQEAKQTWRDCRATKEARGANGDQSMTGNEERNAAARKALLARFEANLDDHSRDMEHALGQVPLMTLNDQDRVAAIIRHQEVQDWLLDPLYGGLLIHGNGRRHDPLAPTSVASALLVHLFSRKFHFPTLYWFCGLHNSGPNGNALGMLRGLICQFLCLSCCTCSSRDQDKADTQDLEKLLKLFRRLLRQSTPKFPVVCILDGLSYYEGRHQSETLGIIVNEFANLANCEPPKLILLMTSAMRTSYLSQVPAITRNFTVAEVPDHIDGLRLGLNSVELVADTEARAKGLLEHLLNGRQVDY